MNGSHALRILRVAGIVAVSLCSSPLAALAQSPGTAESTEPGAAPTSAPAPAVDAPTQTQTQTQTYEEQAGEVHPDGVPVVMRRGNSLAGRVELNVPTLGISLNDKFTEHVVTQLGVLYHLNEMFAIEVNGGFSLLARETSLTKTLRDPTRFDKAEAGGRVRDLKSEVTDMNVVKWYAGGDFQWEPMYGKVSVFSDLDLRFSMYLLLGGGIAGTERTPLCDATPATGTPNPNCVKSKITGTAPLAQFGGGLRLFLRDWLSVKAELRDLYATSTLKVEPNASTTGGTTEYVSARDWTHYPIVFIGTGLLF